MDPKFFRYRFPKTVFSRDSYLDSILRNITANDAKVLIKYLEECSQCRGFSRIFPTDKTHQYFQFFDYLSYYDKLLDAFEYFFNEDRESGLQFVNELCRKNVHK